MNIVNHCVPRRRTPRPRVSRCWLVSSLALVLPLLAGCLIQRPPTFAGLASGLDNAKQARIRTVNAVLGAPRVDVYLNGLPVVNGGKLQQNMAVGQFSGWVYLTPGVYTLALVPHGGTLAQALFAPMAVNAAAGHRYTVAALGQRQDQDVKPLLIDETALAARIDAKATASSIISLHNLKGAASIDVLANGRPMVTNLKYGAMKAFFCYLDTFHRKDYLTGQPAAVLGEGASHCDPGANYSAAYFGTYPGAIAGNASQGTSELNLLDFLAGFNSHQVVDQQSHGTKFKTLLAAIDRAGLHDLFVNPGPYFFLAPTDEAFSWLSKAQRDSLLNDPQALTTLLKAHFMAGYYPDGSLSGATYGQANREVTNLLGQHLQFLGDALNGQAVLGGNYTVGNGNRVQFIYKLLPVK